MSTYVDLVAFVPHVGEVTILVPAPLPPDERHPPPLALQAARSRKARRVRVSRRRGLDHGQGKAQRGTALDVLLRNPARLRLPRRLVLLRAFDREAAGGRLRARRLTTTDERIG